VPLSLSVKLTVLKLEAIPSENGSRFVLRGENSIQLYGRKGEKATGTIYIHFRCRLINDQ
jgi:hypothetical protein